MSLHNPISPLRALYVQKVLPAVYDDSLSYYEVLAKTQEKLNEVISDTNEVNELVLELQQAMYDFTHGGYTDSFEEYLDKWFEDNSDEFVQRLIDEGVIPEVEDLQSDINSMHGDIADLVAADTTIRNDMVAADTELQAADTAIRSDMVAADTAIRSDMEAADMEIINDMTAADTAIRSDMEAADLALTDTKVPYPLVGAIPSYGTNGQVLTTNADGTTDWQDPVVPSDAQAEEIITEWLNEHPEATTTVLDGAITYAKLADDVKDMFINATVDTTWNSGYVNSNGNVVSPSNTRQLSELVPCMAGETITYLAESNHASVLGISFWNENEEFISGIGNIDPTRITEHTATVPDNATYFRISALNNQHPYAKVNTKIERNNIVEFTNTTSSAITNVNESLTTMEDDITSLDTIVSNIASLKSASYALTGNWTSYSSTELRGTYQGDFTKFTVNIDDGVSDLRYGVRFMSGEQVVGSTGWITATDTFDTREYTNVDSIVIRLQNASGTGSIDISRAQDVSLSCDIEIVDAVNNLLNKVEIAYVDSTNGSDSNDGTSRTKAFATIGAALSADRKVIIVREGEYPVFSMGNKRNVIITIDHNYDSYVAGESENNPKVTINGNGSSSTGINLNQCYNITLEGIEVRNCINNGILINNSSSITIIDCVTHDIYNASKSNAAAGFKLTKTDANLYNCLAYNIGTTSAGAGSTHSDGFNIHETGTVNLYDCNAYNCEDDGVSHHDASFGVIDGGEWHHCGKGGVASPTHGATCNVKNVYSHDNRYGVYIDNQNATGTRNNVLLTTCIFNNNRDYDVYAPTFYILVLMKCAYTTIDADNTIIFA